MYCWVDVWVYDWDGGHVPVRLTKPVAMCDELTSCVDLLQEHLVCNGQHVDNLSHPPINQVAHTGLDFRGNEDIPDLEVLHAEYGQIDGDRVVLDIVLLALLGQAVCGMGGVVQQVPHGSGQLCKGNGSTGAYMTMRVYDDTHGQYDW